MRSFNNKGVNKKRHSPSPFLGNPFTYAQLKELERQIFIYNYFMACVSVPSYLLSSTPTSSSSSNTTDPIEGRCRRTDGRRWRCYRYAAPNNKYCQRHMHRGSARSGKSAELRINHTGKYSSHFLASTASLPYLRPSFSFGNHSFGLKLAPCFVPSNMQPRPRILNGDPMSLGASNSGWHNNIPVNQYMMSLPQYSTLVYNPLLVPHQSGKPRGNSCNASASVDQSRMNPLGEMLRPCNVISISDSPGSNPSSPVTSNPVKSVNRS